MPLRPLAGVTGETRGDECDIGSQASPATVDASCACRHTGSASHRIVGIKSMSGIAIYEQDDLMRCLLAEWLSDAGYRIRGSARPTVQSEVNLDLVILSIYMPKHAGAQLVNEIRAAHPGTPLIALSGQFRCGLSTAGATAQTLGVAQVIAKPLTRDALLQAIHAMIGLPKLARCIPNARVKRSVRAPRRFN